MPGPRLCQEAQTAALAVAWRVLLKPGTFGRTSDMADPEADAPSVNEVANFYERGAMRAPRVQAIAALLNCAFALGCGGKSTMRSEDDTASSSGGATSG